MELTGQSISAVSHALAAGETTSRALVESALESIAADGRAFTHVDFAAARDAAVASDTTRARGVVPSAISGIPISVKDLFDVEGEPTPAGSVILRNAPAAERDAPVIARLRQAGAVIIGRTHMSEFAFTGLGLNPHWPVLPNPADEHRAPGGSSSGAAASVARGQCVVGLGTDTGGSVRIPAAFCGLTGFKPTQARITRAGVFPLSPSLDSIGPIANSVACCRIFNAVIADAAIAPHAAVSSAQMRFAVPDDLVLDDLDQAVGRDFELALARISGAGAKVERIPFPEFAELPKLNARGALVNAEAFAVHRAAGLLERRADYDRDVLARIEIGERMSAEGVREILAARGALSAGVDQRAKPYDALLFPSAATVAPRLSEIAAPTGFARANALALRNAALVNFFDRCALSLPMQPEGALPTGLMIVGERMGDARLLAIGETVETILRRH